MLSCVSHTNFAFVDDDMQPFLNQITNVKFLLLPFVISNENTIDERILMNLLVL